MLDVVDGSMVRQRFSMTLILLFGASALLLAAVGIYGVIAYSVSQRTTEVAIRSALGAAPSDVLKMILTYGGSVAGAGLVAGAIAAILLRNVVASQLYGISALDPVVLAGVPILLGVIALVATYLPARRVLKIDLADTLRRG
jgi:ABC-type antimicrobial peptide transport system permease subunit